MATSGRGTTTDTSILQFVLGKATFTAPTGGAYARAAVGAGTNLPADWSATTTDATGVWKTNAAAITFPTASAGWTAATGYGLYDASSAGTLLYWGTFGSATTVGSGATASFAAGALKVTEA